MIKELINTWIHPHCPRQIWNGLCVIRHEIRKFQTNQSSPRTAFRFLCTPLASAGLATRTRLILKFCQISRKVNCPHSQHEMLEVATAILSFPKDKSGGIVEAGCYKGGSAAKLSLVAALAERDLILFDSFEGLPDNDEEHYTTAASDAGAGTKVDCFGAGNYTGSLEEVRQTIEKFGDLSRCQFKKGWFCDTMPEFSEDVCVAYIDVDLVLSTKDCIANLYRTLVPGGKIYSQDGHLVKIQELFANPVYWKKEIGCHPPLIDGLGSKRMVRIEFAH